MPSPQRRNKAREALLQLVAGIKRSEKCVRNASLSFPHRPSPSLTPAPIPYARWARPRARIRIRIRFRIRIRERAPDSGLRQRHQARRPRPQPQPPAQREPARARARAPRPTSPRADRSATSTRTAAGRFLMPTGQVLQRGRVGASGTGFGCRCRSANAPRQPLQHKGARRRGTRPTSPPCWGIRAWPSEPQPVPPAPQPARWDT